MKRKTQKWLIVLLAAAAATASVLGVQPDQVLDAIDLLLGVLPA